MLMCSRTIVWKRGITLVIEMPLRPFDAAATAHPEQAERVEGCRRGFAQGEPKCFSPLEEK